ncbi:MAG: hypothetical protein ACI4ES_00240 [Roseburia sp.]
MIILKANTELKLTYEKLIRTMGERVDWNGRFVIIDNYLILQGEVRSLFFNFENRKVVSNIIDLPVQEELVLKLENYPKLENIINMTLYAFGKWGTIKGIKVEQDYQQLNRIFSGILQEYHVEPGFSKENYRFYKDGIRITYEDMVQIAIDAADKPLEEDSEKEEEEQGLWHKLIWKNQQYSFSKVETTLAERQQNRLGHNFYMVGYLCPKCKEKLHMVVYPVGREQKIETEEGGVYLARAYTCDTCNCFYTPRPERLIQEGSVYEMTFAGDRTAYEDYLELLGEKGERTSNYNYNEYAVVHNRKKQAGHQVMTSNDENERFENADEAWAQMEALCRRLRDMPEQELSRFLARIEDGFYPDILLEQYEPQIARQVRERKARREEEKSKDGTKIEGEEESQLEKAGEVEERKGPERNPESKRVAESKRVEKEKMESAFSKEKEERQNEHSRIKEESKEKERKESVEEIDEEIARTGVKVFAGDGQSETRIKQLQARLNVWERMSPRQRQELKQAVQKEKQINEPTRRYFMAQIKHLEEKESLEHTREMVKSCEGKPYATIKRVYDEVEKAEIPKEEKISFLEQLKGWLKQTGKLEVEELMKQMTGNLDRKQFKALMGKIKSYEGIDLAPYQKEIAICREATEGQEAANMVNRARKKTRSDLTDLMKRMETADFEPETIAPYLDDLTAKLEEIDQKAIDEICDDVMHMDFNEAVEAYEQIEEGDFLPKLKTNALEMLSKRLAKIKTDECESLVEKLKDDMAGKIRPNEKHYFYPARKVLMKNASEEETEVIDYALATYAGNRGLFEYPILVVDTSRNGSGKEGMILTPEHIFTSTLLNAFYAPIKDIRSIKSSTGLLNKGIWIEQKNGTKIKVPFAVENDEIKKWAEILGDFIQYLQEKPESRNLQYLAKEKHETICCFRCGHVYKGGNVCPECGYKSNK